MTLWCIVNTIFNDDDNDNDDDEYDEEDNVEFGTSGLA